MWFKKAKITNTLTKAITANPNISVFQVLSNSELLQSIRNEVQELLDYFSADNEKHLKELFDLALSNNLNSDKYDFRYNRNASNLLSSVARNFQKMIQSSPTTASSLTSFMKDPSRNRDPVFSGHFQRIVQCQQFPTNGKFIEQLPNLSNFLLDNIDVIGYKQLLVSLIVDFYDNLADPEICQKISNIAAENSPRSVHALFVFTDVMKDRPVQSILFTEGIYRNLLTLAYKAKKDEKGQFIYFEVFNAIKLITNEAEKPEWLEKLKKEFVDKFPFDEKVPSASAFAAFPFFADYAIEKMINFFFEENVPPMYAQATITCIKKMEKNKRDAFITNHHLLEKILDSEIKRPDDKSGYEVKILEHVFQLSRLFLYGPSIPIEKKCRTKWDVFICDQILPREDLIKDYSNHVEDEEDSDQEQ